MQRAGIDLRTTGIVIGQVWRAGGAGQARLARLLTTVETVPVDEALGRRAGELLAHSGTSDPIDATVVAVTSSGDRVMNGDPDDIGVLLDSAGVDATLVPC